MNLSIDDSFRYRLNPEQILTLYGTVLLVYLLISFGWLANTISVRNPSTRFNLLHRNFTTLILIKVLIQIIAFVIVYWTLVKGPTYFGLDIVSLITLLYFGMFYATFTLISRGWCVTKGPKELSHSDRQMTFLMAFGMTITELISAGYNKFATVSLVFMYCIFIRMVLMSFDLLIKKLGDEVVSLSARRVAPILIQPIQSRQKLLKQLRVLSMVYFVMIISTRVSAFFIRSIAIVIAEEAIHVVVLLSWAVLLRKRKETHIKLSLEQNGRVMINSAPLMGEAVNEEANNQLHVVESPGLSVERLQFLNSMMDRKYHAIIGPCPPNGLPIVQLATLDVSLEK